MIQAFFLHMAPVVVNHEMGLRGMTIDQTVHSRASENLENETKQHSDKVSKGCSFVEVI